MARSCFSSLFVNMGSIKSSDVKTFLKYRNIVLHSAMNVTKSYKNNLFSFTFFTRDMVCKLKKTFNYYRNT